MGKVYEAITDGVRAWVDAQPMFFVSTAPLAADGHVNSSPRGHDALRILGPHPPRMDGSHGVGRRDDCASEGERPYLRDAVRIRGCAADHAFPRAWPGARARESGVHALAPAFPDLPGARAIIEVEVQRIADSCGYAVPRMEVIEQRDVLVNWAEKRGVDGLEAYRQECNASSLDGLPAWDGAIANDD